MASDANPAFPFGRIFNRQQLILAVWHGWKFILFFAAVWFWYELGILHHSIPVYQAQMEVTTAQSSDASAPSGINIATTLASLAFPAPQEGSNFRFYVDSLTSRDLADALAKNPTIMHEIFADQWDSQRQTWHEPAPSRNDRIRDSVKRFLGLPLTPWHAPDGETLLYFMTSNVGIIQDPRRPYITKITFDSVDRKFAVDFLYALHQAADGALRQKELKRTTQNIDFLSKNLATTTIAEHRFALAQALSQQEQVAMNARNTAPFAAEFFEQPWVSTLPVAPQPMQQLTSAVFFGAVVGGLIAILRWNTRDWTRAWLRRLFFRKKPIGASG